MAKLPKLKIRGLGWDVSEGIRDFEQAKYLPFGQNVIILVEGNAIKSYEDLIRLASQNPHRDKEFLEVKFLELLRGG
jgi:hypothetical protein